MFQKKESMIQADYQPLDESLKPFFGRTVIVLCSILEDLLVTIREMTDDDPKINLLRWAIMYSVVLRDICRSASLLFNDGGHTRAALIIRRTAFEYHTKFRFFAAYPHHATTAMNEFQQQSEKFAKRVPGQVTFVYGEAFDAANFESAGKPYRNFEAICRAVYGDRAAECYAHFYSYPSSLLHGDAMVSMDILANQDGREFVHLDSARPFTNEIAANMLVFLLDFAGDVARAFEVKDRAVVGQIGCEFNAVRKRLKLLSDGGSPDG